MEIKYSELALLDLENIIDFIAKDSIKRAIDYIEKIKNHLEILKKSPNLGVECRKKKINQDCRVFIFESYLVFYSVLEKSVEIKRVLHSSVDYQSKLK